MYARQRGCWAPPTPHHINPSTTQRSTQASRLTAAPAALPTAAAAAPLNGPLPINGELAARNVTFGGLRTLTVLALHQDEYVGGSVLSTGQPFEPATLQLMLDKIRPGSTVVDAGCNFGSYSVFFAARAGGAPGGRVHCFEPQRKMAQVRGARAAMRWGGGGETDRQTGRRCKLRPCRPVACPNTAPLFPQPHPSKTRSSPTPTASRTGCRAS